MDKELREQIVHCEELAANAHVALNILQYDGWILHFSEGHTGRANSVSVLYPSHLDPDEKIDYCERQYAAQNLPCVFKLTDGDEALMDKLVKRGYTDITPSAVMRTEVRDIRMPEGEIVLSDHLTEEWLEPYFAFEGFDERHQGIYRRMLDKLCLKAVYAAVKEQGAVVAVASAVEDNGQMLIQNVIVDAAHRGKGYGRAVCTALLAKAAEDGIHTCFLQVLQKNAVAHSLYESLGFQQVYNYCYMKKE